MFLSRGMCSRARTLAMCITLNTFFHGCARQDGFLAISAPSFVGGRLTALIWMPSLAVLLEARALATTRPPAARRQGRRLRGFRMPLSSISSSPPAAARRIQASAVWGQTCFAMILRWWRRRTGFYVGPLERSFPPHPHASGTCAAPVFALICLIAWRVPFAY